MLIIYRRFILFLISNSVILKRILKIILRIVLGFVVFVALYILFAFLFSIISTSPDPQKSQDVEIHILTNGVHTDIVVPVKNDLIDWSKQIKYSIP